MNSATEPVKAVAVSHMLRVDHPSATSHRLQKTLCGIYVRPSEIADYVDAATCPVCQRWQAAYEALDI